MVLARPCILCTQNVDNAQGPLEVFRLRLDKKKTHVGGLRGWGLRDLAILKLAFYVDRMYGFGKTMHSVITEYR